MHRTSKGEFLIRSNDGNRPIEPYEMATIMAEKGMIVYDQKTWNISGDWLDTKRLSELRDMLETKNPDSPYLEKNDDDFLDSLALTKEEDGRILPTTTGILFVGNAKALRELPYYEVKYIHYYSDGTYKPYEFKGNIISVAKECFAQLKSEIKQKEYIFGLFREFVEDYSEIVIRELLINALAHRDLSRQQIVEIRKYDDGGYLDSVETINNTEARELLKLKEKDRSLVSRLFAELVSENEIMQTKDSRPNNVKYRRIT